MSWPSGKRSLARAQEYERDELDRKVAHIQSRARSKIIYRAWLKKPDDTVVSGIRHVPVLDEHSLRRADYLVQGLDEAMADQLMREHRRVDDYVGFDVARLP